MNRTFTARRIPRPIDGLLVENPMYSEFRSKIKTKIFMVDSTDTNWEIHNKLPHGLAEAEMNGS